MGGPVFLAWSFAPLTLLVVIAAFAIRAIWVTITPPRKGVKQPSCEKCKYPVSGLTTPNCPECGNDLRQTGIITRPMEIRRRGGLGGAILGLTYLLLCGFGLSMLLLSILTTRNLTASSAPSVGTTILTPRSGAYASIKFEQPFQATTSTESGAAYLAAVQVRLSDGSARRLEVAPNRRCVSVADGVASAPIGSLSAATIADWFTTIGLDCTNSAVTAEADETARILDITTITPFTSPSQMSVSAFSVGPTTFAGADATTYSQRETFLWTIVAWSIPVVFIGLWVILTLLIVFRRRRLLREADAPSASAAPAVSA